MNRLGLCVKLFLPSETGKATISSSHGKAEASDSDSTEILMGEVNIEELPLYSFDVLASSTNNFDMGNQLGMGGFGAVYQVNFRALQGLDLLHVK